MAQPPPLDFATDFARHGGRLDMARSAYPAAPEPWLDLSTGINPRAWAPRRPIAIDPAPLPTVSALAGLEAAAAGHFGSRPANTAAVPGSEIALRLLPGLGLPRPIVAAMPAYGTHLAIADGHVEHGAIAGGTGHAGTILLANPNNPDGRRWDRATLLALAERQRAAGGWLVVDEAFADAVPADALSPVLTPDLPVIVLRSFGKFFGLAGLRLGFVVAAPAIVGRLRALLGDWPVGAQAIAWGAAAYADADWIAATRVLLCDAAATLDAMLARHGLDAQGACPLFRLVRDAAAPALFDRLARTGILTRPFADRPEWLRFGLPGTAAAFARLDGALHAALAGG